LKIALYTEGSTFTGDTPERRGLGGSESAFVAVARELARLGHEVRAYCHCDGEGVFDGVVYRDLARIGELAHDGCELFLCSRFFTALGLPMQAQARFLWLHDLVETPLIPMLQEQVGRIDAAYALSRYHHAQVAGAVPSLTERLQVTHNGVDRELVAAATAGVSKRHQIMFTSRPERGLGRALDIFERLDDRALELVVCTYYPFAATSEQIRSMDTNGWARIAALVARGYRIRSVSFDKRALYRELAASKAVLYPTDFPESSCISALEAQACGTVFVTTDDFALRETVAYPGLPRHDVDGFVRRLRELLADDDARRGLEERGRVHVAPLTWQAVARRFADDATQLLARRASAPTAMPSPPSTLPSRAWPLMSCLTVTGKRIRLLKRSIQHYLLQRYPHRELVIVAQGDARYRQALTDHLAELGRADIRLEFCDDGATLGRLRNLSLDAARGELICQWDDDDCNHPDRLVVQAEHMWRERAAACFFTDHLQLVTGDRAIHWIDWVTSRPTSPLKWQLLPGTVMMAKDRRFRYPEQGPSAVRGEDTAFLDDLYDVIPVAALRDAGYLYLYTFHGRNTFSEEHHRALSRTCKPLDFVREKEQQVRQALRHFAAPRPLTVFGGGEVAYVVNE
jgi:glycosyltransferase involved in cell wall biosynthesis